MIIHQSFIFAAGRGERMRPLTDSTPKPLIKVKDKAILDHLIEKVNKISAISKIIINGFYLAQQIEDHLKKLNNPKIIFSREASKIETGGGLLYAKNNIDMTQPILLINGDILWQENGGISDIEELCSAYNPKDCDILLGLKKNGEVLGYEGKGDFDFNQKTGEVFKMKDQPSSHVFIGVQVVNPSILKEVPAECFSMSYFYKKAVMDNGKVNRIKGFEMNGRYFHIGDVKALAAVEAVL